MYKILIAGKPVSNCQECNVSASSARDINSLPENLLLADTSVWAPAHRCTIIKQYSERSLASSSQDRAQLDQLCSILFPKSHIAKRGETQDGEWGRLPFCFRTDEFPEDNNKFRSQWCPLPLPALQCQLRSAKMALPGFSPASRRYRWVCSRLSAKR